MEGTRSANNVGLHSQPEAFAGADSLEAPPKRRGRPRKKSAEASGPEDSEIVTEEAAAASLEPAVPVPAKRRRRREVGLDAADGVSSVGYTPRYLSNGALIVESAKLDPRNPLARAVLENLRRYPHCILLTRVGQFYEVWIGIA